MCVGNSVSLINQFDLFWVQLDKVRPAVVISTAEFSSATKMVQVAPVTSTNRCNHIIFGKFYVEFTNAFGEVKYINLSGIQLMPVGEIDRREYFGHIVDRSIQEKIMDVVDRWVNGAITYSGVHPTENVRQQVSMPKPAEVPKSVPMPKPAALGKDNREFTVDEAVMIRMNRGIDKCITVQDLATLIIGYARPGDDQLRSIYQVTRKKVSLIHELEILLFIVTRSYAESQEMFGVARTTIYRNVEVMLEHLVSHGKLSRDAESFYRKLNQRTPGPFDYDALLEKAKNPNKVLGRK